MIQYHTPEGQDKKSYTFTQAILQGIARDGGLLMPDTIPQITLEQLQNLVHNSYQSIAAFVLDSFSLDSPKELCHQVINNAYGDHFDTKIIAPVVPLMVAI